MVVTLCSCSTISKRQNYSYPLPPLESLDVWGREPVQNDSKLEALHNSDPSNEPLRLLVRYQQAKLWSSLDAKKSCALWSEVLSEPRFPLFHIARLRAMEVCDQEAARFPPIDDVMRETTEPWLSDLLLRSSLARAKRTDNKAWEMRLTFSAVDLAKLQTEKLKLLARAKELANELNNSDDAQVADSRMVAAAPRLTKNPMPDQLLSVATDFRQARDFENARGLFIRATKEPSLSSFEKLKAYDGLRLSFKLEKKTDEYLKASKEFSDFAERDFLKEGLKLFKTASTREAGRALIKKYYETRITFARAVWTENSPTEAARILEAAERDVKSTVPIHDSLLLRARIDEEAGRFEKTVATLEKIDPKKVPGRETRLKILWSLAWNKKKIGRVKDAANDLESLIAQEDSTSAAARDRFWLAKFKYELGDTESAISQYEKLIESDATSWYALLAYRELKREMPSLAQPAPVRLPASERTIESASAFMPEEKLTFEWLLAAKEFELAKKFLNQIARDRKATYSSHQQLDLFRAFAKAGDFQSLFTALSELPTARRLEILEQAPELSFPQPWAPLVATASKKFRVQPELIYSIMRQESSFDPLARSPADAFGLMQLIPEMAKRAEADAGIKLSSHEDLYNPETNIPLGTAFVRELLDHWNGGFIPSVASYNASEKAISGWLKSRYRGDVLMFIEDIPYEETRNYIKLVMRNYVFYQRLNSGGASVPFPEWCLANLQPEKP